MVKFQELENKYNFHACNLENKYWGINSILVPETKPTIDENFKGFREIYKEEQNLSHFTEIYWDEPYITGEIKLPDEGNYCYINNKAYHLIKTQSDGVVKFKDGSKHEMYYYQIIYDDWVNEFLENNVNVMGNIIKTGDIDKVRVNIHRTIPLIQNVNSIDEFDCGQIKEENKWVFDIPTDKFYENNSFFGLNPKTQQLLSNFLKTDYERKFNYDEDTLTLPIVAQETKIGNGKTAIATSLVEYLNVGVAIYDINKKNFDYPTFMGKYRALSSDNKQDEQVYVLTQLTGVKHAAETYVRGIGLKNINLRGLTDIKELKSNMQDIDPEVDRTGKNLTRMITNKIYGDFKFETQDELTKIAYENGIYDTINTFIIAIGGRLFTNISPQGSEWIKGNLPRDKYEEFGFYENVRVEHRENRWEEGTYNKRKFNHDYFGWFDFYKPGDYMTGNRFQKNHVLYRNVSSFSGSMFMGASRKNSTYLKKIDGKTYRQGIDELKRNSDPGSSIKPDIEITAENDNGYLYTDKYDGTENFNFASAETNHKIRGLIHLDRYKLVENVGGKRKEIKPYKGIMLVPDYENEAYVLAEYETNDITEGVMKKNGINKVLAFSEVLDHVNPVKNYDINNPDENLLTGTEWQKVSHSIRLGTVIKRLLLPLPDEEEHKQPKVRFKRGYKSGTSEYTAEDEYSYKLHYYVPDIPGRGNGRLTVPIECEADFQKIVDKYRDIHDYNFAGLRGDNKTNKGIKTPDKYYCPVFDTTKTDFLDSRELMDIPSKTRRNTLYIFVDIHPRKSASEDEKQRLKLLIEELHTAFFRSPGSENITYQSSNIPGNVKKMVYKKDDDPNNNINYGTMTNLRPYKGVWYSSRIIIDEKFEAGYDAHDSWYESRKKEHIFTGSGTNNHKDGIILIPIGTKLEYKDYPNYKWIEALNNLYIMGQADRIDNTPNGIFTQNAIDFQETEGYKGNGRNTRGDLGRRIERQTELGNSAIFMETIKDKSIQYTDKNLENPKTFIPFNYHINDLNKLQEFYAQQSQVIPDYIWKYINPESVASPLHTIPKLDLNEMAKSEFSIKKGLATNVYAKIQKAFLELHTSLISQPVLFDLVGTNFLALASYNANKKGSFELIIKQNEGVLVKEGRKKCIFTNYKTEEDTVPKAINSMTELNVYGHKIPLKERFTLEGSNLNIDCHIEKIPDKHQSPSDGFFLTIKTKTDFIRTQVEVPKEQTIRANIALHEKQRLFNEFLYNNADRYGESQKYNLDKEQFYRNIKREEKYQGWDIAGDVLGFTTNLLSLKGMALGGWPGAIIGGLNIGSSIYNAVYRHTKRTEERNDRLEFGTKNFIIQGESMSSKHKSAEEADRLTLQNLANNNRYPEFNNSLVFEELNKLINRTNLYLTRYSPEGDILEMIKDHYDEYGYDIYLTKQTCTGINDIKKHIQFLTIAKNIHHNNTIRQMIELRLLNGVKVI